MVRSRVPGGKKISTHSIRSSDARILKIDVYLVRAKSPYGKTFFQAICDEINLDEKHTDLDELTELAKTKARERTSVFWTPVLVVSVSGVERQGGNGEGSGLFYASVQHTESLSLEVVVERFELAEVAGRKIRRHPPHPHSSRTPDVREGWPETGVVGYSKDRVVSMISDTLENRVALERVRAAMAGLTERLGELLCPARVEETLAQIAEVPLGLLALPAPSEAPTKPATPKPRTRVKEVP